MAMHTKLKVGTVLFYFLEFQDRREYIPEIHAIENRHVTILSSLEVYNRRARTNGALVPQRLIPLLDSFKIRNYKRGKINTVAVGCTKKTIETYSSAEEEVPFFIYQKYQQLMNELENQPIEQSEFLEKFLAKQKNTIKKGLLFTPFEQRRSYIPIIHLQERNPEDSMWSISRYEH